MRLFSYRKWRPYSARPDRIVNNKITSVLYRNYTLKINYKLRKKYDNVETYIISPYNINLSLRLLISLLNIYSRVLISYIPYYFQARNIDRLVIKHFAFKILFNVLLSIFII